MRTLIVFVFALITAASAQADVSYSVFGVRPGDTLNMRSQPNPNAPVVQTIPFDGRDIGLTGRNAPGAWVEVMYNRKRGWVNGRFLGYSAPGRYQVPAHLECFGTEPFWSIKLQPGAAQADLAFAERRLNLRLTQAESAMNRNDILHLRGVSRPGEMSLILRAEVCSDGMSDNRYPYSVVALFSRLNVIAGCCRLAAPR